MAWKGPPGRDVSPTSIEESLSLFPCFTKPERPGRVRLSTPPAPLQFCTVSTTPTRVFAARLAGLPVFDPQGDQVGKVRDVVVVMRPGASSLVSQPRVVGLVVEVFGRRQIFAPMTRITSIDAGQVITTGLLNMRRFAKRS